MNQAKFVTLTKEEFENILPEDFTLIDVPRALEYIYHIPTGINGIGICIYSSVDKRTNTTRDKGEDAIRLIYWDTKNNQPLGRTRRRINRVEGKTTIEDRLTTRIIKLIQKAHKVNATDYEYVHAVLYATTGGKGFSENLISQLATKGILSPNQLACVIGEDKSPSGYDTLETQAKKKNPNFLEDYLDSMTEDTTTTTTTEETEEAGEDDQQIQEVRPKNPTPAPEPETEIELISTENYPYHDYPFDYFNPVQSATLPYAAGENNLVIGANTSAGKTIAAELLIDETLQHPTHNRVIYLSPLKSLTQEKYDDWQVRYPDQEITILTGDYTLSEKMKDKLSNSNIIVMTSEMCDSRTRRMKSEKNYWLQEVGLVIVDESHIISTNRGHAVEAGLMRFTSINYTARILFLSATMPNCDELAEWITNMNGKPTDVVFNTWRPVVLEMNYPTYHYAYRDYWGNTGRKRDLAFDIAMGQHPDAIGKENEKFLIFCHDKGTGRALVKRLTDAGEEAHFHNAGLEMKDRLEIEAQFEDRNNGIRILVSTSTLAWGRNLPARNVIIVGIHRGIDEVDPLDIIQMAGRAGRYGIDDAGTVYLCTPDNAIRACRHNFENPRPVTSILNSRKILAFHVLAEIENGNVKSTNDVFNWYQRSLAAYQAINPFDEDDIRNLLIELEDMEMITFRGKQISPAITGLGKVSAWLYYSPYDIHAWHLNFQKYYELDNKDDIALTWALTDIPENDWGYIPKDIESKTDALKYELAYNYNIKATQAVVASVAGLSCITGTKGSCGTERIHMRTLRYDIRRISQALKLIDSMYAKWDLGVWDTLHARILYGVSEEIVELTKVPGIGGATAKKLYDKGIKNLTELAAYENLPKIELVVNPIRAKKFRKDAVMIIKHGVK